jgi:hypothetical protein
MHDSNTIPIESQFARDPSTVVKSKPRSRSRIHAGVQLLRRSHLYAGLFMLPWTMVYALSAVLFNHPQLLPDRTEVSFGKDALTGTAMDSLVPPAELARQVIVALQARNPAESYALIQPEKARYAPDGALVSARAGNQDVTLFVNGAGTGGFIRSREIPPPKRAEARAPFAVGGPSAGAPNAIEMRPQIPEGRPPRAAANIAGDAIRLEHPLNERIRAAAPKIFEKLGFLHSQINTVFVPDLTFLMTANTRIWKVKYHFETGSVSGESPDADQPTPRQVSTRGFLTALHLAHGYSDGADLRWTWAFIVDAMAAVMVFWGFSGLFMWWQIKKTRRLGTIVLVLSALMAVWVSVGMHSQMTMPR